ncbi:hypothetical protein, partial [Pseudomonas sp. GW460-5]|uniref:hypothetical protein n=1 Tax=Pseudomonas sp. GW460-5 TaxID=2070643 RepID=UPI001C46480E
TSGYQLAIHRSHFRFYSFSKTQAGLSREAPRGRRSISKAQDIHRHTHVTHNLYHFLTHPHLTNREDDKHYH